MTPQTVNAGIGMVLISVGILIVTYTRSALAERRSQRTVREVKDLVKMRTFLRRARNAEVPEIRIPGTVQAEVTVVVSGRVPMQPLSSDEWDRLQREISEQTA